MVTKSRTIDPPGGQMGRGLYDLDNGILGIACAVNIHTQGLREPRVKPPGFDGPVDYRTPLGICLLHAIAPSIEFGRIDPRYVEVMRRAGMFFEDTPQLRRAQAASSRAASRLVGRRFLAWHKNDYIRKFGSGYVLTDKGIEVGKRNLRPIPMIDETLAFFGITAEIGGRVPGMPPAEYIDRIKSALNRGSK
jgi:hypothetical protein